MWIQNRLVRLGVFRIRNSSIYCTRKFWSCHCKEGKGTTFQLKLQNLNKRYKTQKMYETWWYNIKKKVHYTRKGNISTHSFILSSIFSKQCETYFSILSNLFQFCCRIKFSKTVTCFILISCYVKLQTVIPSLNPAASSPVIPVSDLFNRAAIRILNKL